MKKYLSFFAAAVMASCAVVSCNKPNNDDDPEEPEEPVSTDVEIAIDGDFSDWAAITETSADKKVYFCADGADGYKNIRNLKATSDENCIYMYFEVAASKIYMADGYAQGNSWDGIPGLKAESWAQPIWIYIDSDNNPATGLKCHWVGEIEDGGPAFSDFQFDNGINIYTVINRQTGRWEMGWQQCNVKLAEVEDGTEINSSSYWDIKTDDYPDGYGWDHNKDNTLITFDNFKTKVEGGWCICEIAIDRTLLVNNQAKEATNVTEIAFGIANQRTSAEGTAGGFSGIIPGDRKPAVLKLN